MIEWKLANKFRKVRKIVVPILTQKLRVVDGTWPFTVTDAIAKAVLTEVLQE